MEDEVLTRLRASIAAAERGPTELELMDAPGLVVWGAVLSAGYGIALSGPVIGHPLLGKTLAVTSLVIRVAPDRTWARTLSRWYQLGSRADDRVLRSWMAGTRRLKAISANVDLDAVVEFSVARFCERHSG